jgi:glycosyltransferase involved in cell wall biosynthesis
MATLITDFDLTRLAEPVYVDPRYNGLFVTVRWGNLPLGVLEIPVAVGQRLISAQWLRAQAVEEFGWQVWKQFLAHNLDVHTQTRAAELPPISVVVCTRDRVLSLERTLQSLARQDYPDFEVIVVDNCSRDDGVRRVVERSGFRYAYQEHPGLDWARNKGIQEARHAIVAFIDDDALATPGWLRGLAFGFSDLEVMAVTGLVLPAELESPAQMDFESYGGMSKGFTSFTIRKEKVPGQAILWASGWGVGTNMAFRKELFEAIGNFDVALDVGTPTGGGGDIEYFFRCVDAGYTLRYEPAALVRHVHRRDKASLDRQVYYNGCSFPAYLITIAGNNPGLRMVALRFGLRYWLWGWLIKRWVMGELRRDHLTAHFARIELRGALSSFGAYRRSRRSVLADQNDLKAKG